MIKTYKYQQGIVLFFSLIVLVLMTIIGVALAVSSTQSLRMSGAGSDRLAATSLALGGLNTVISKSVVYQFSTTTDPKRTVAELSGSQDITLMPLDNPGIDVSCQRTEKANAANLINCRRVEISSTVNYGRGGYGELSVTMGVEQEVLKEN
ncbi:pilus assembly protein PilX [Shewanella sp. 11B5]|uniref:Type IV pilus assembly protein PilX n=1 Tax=Shewanella frigidimarina (strain NCIMB 400) TaxID=318167 RepID=Q07Z41_SHEFN|nr:MULTISPECIES: PilX N-terminal domain-containing pilus assembly protein [Shewanella]ABI72723.1 type IV pilus assembly protein PilX [Shewanella frigidimarina NCIMB 400]PKH98026.1 pilus assembly protein PilX [Shewanella sp. 11B5]